MIKISHLISHCYDRQAGYLSVITTAYQVRSLDHFLKFRLTGFRLSEINCTSRSVHLPFICTCAGQRDSKILMILGILHDSILFYEVDSKN